MQYSKTTTHQMCTKLDFPPVSSAIIWARQVHMHVYMYAKSLYGILYQHCVAYWSADCQTTKCFRVHVHVAVVDQYIQILHHCLVFSLLSGQASFLQSSVHYMGGFSNILRLLARNQCTYMYMVHVHCTHTIDWPSAPDLPPACWGCPWQRLGEPCRGTEAQTRWRRLQVQAQHPAAVWRLEKEGGVTSAGSPRTDIQHCQFSHPLRYHPQATSELCTRDHHSCKGGTVNLIVIRKSIRPLYYPV